MACATIVSTRAPVQCRRCGVPSRVVAARGLKEDVKDAARGFQEDAKNSVQPRVKELRENQVSKGTTSVPSANLWPKRSNSVFLAR
jgi:hypothetical protein